MAGADTLAHPGGIHREYRRHLRADISPFAVCNAVAGAVHLAVRRAKGIPAALCSRIVEDALAAIAVAVSQDRAPAPESIADERLAMVLDFIHGHMGEANLSAGRVAAVCRISVRYLHHLFTHHDRTFQEHVRHVRLMRARELLESHATRTMLISEIGYLVGFVSDAHFSRAFRKKFGLSPSDVRPRDHASRHVPRKE